MRCGTLNFQQPTQWGAAVDPFISPMPTGHPETEHSGRSPMAPYPGRAAVPPGILMPLWIRRVPGGLPALTGAAPGQKPCRPPLKVTPSDGHRPQRLPLRSARPWSGNYPAGGGPASCASVRVGVSGRASGLVGGVGPCFSPQWEV